MANSPRAGTVPPSTAMRYVVPAVTGTFAP
jgi:hypothetical protein